MSKFNRMIKTLPAFYKAEVNTYLRGLLKAWSDSDENIQVQIKEAKNQLFVNTAEAAFLDLNANNYGVERDPELGISDADFRNLIPVLSTYPKQVRQTILSLLEVFWGPGFIKANVNSGNIEPFNFGSPDTLTGTFSFKKNDKVVKGTGTSFLSEIIPGTYIRPSSSDDKEFVKVSNVISNTELELSTAWEFPNIALIGAVKKDALSLLYKADAQDEKLIKITPNSFSDITEAYASEIANLINNDPINSSFIEASVFLDPLEGNKLNIRTKTSGLQGAIQVTGGTANISSMLNFSTDKQIDTKVSVYELNPNEIVVRIPSTVPVLRRSLRGSLHPKQQKTIISSNNQLFNMASLGSTSFLDGEVDGNPFSVLLTHSNFADPANVTSSEIVTELNKGLVYLEAFTKEEGNFRSVGLRTTAGSSEYIITGGNANTILQFPTDLQIDPDVIEETYPSSYIFDPNGQLFTVTGTRSTLVNKIEQGDSKTSISLNNSSSFPNSSGLILFNFGRSNQEGPIQYFNRPNNSTLLIDSSHVFSKEQDIGRFVNLVNNTATIPRVTGEDYPVFITGTEQAREVAQDLIKKLVASGVIIRFIIEFPEVLFECKITSSSDPDYVGSLSGGSPLFIC